MDSAHDDFDLNNEVNDLNDEKEEGCHHHKPDTTRCGCGGFYGFGSHYSGGFRWLTTPRHHLGLRHHSPTPQGAAVVAVPVRFDKATQRWCQATRLWWLGEAGEEVETAGEEPGTRRDLAGKVRRKSFPAAAPGSGGCLKLERRRRGN
ncbi:hypothetical protein Tco_0387249 [Tanacetum coccineum]